MLARVHDRFPWRMTVRTHLIATGLLIYIITLGMRLSTCRATSWLMHPHAAGRLNKVPVHLTRFGNLANTTY